MLGKRARHIIYGSNHTSLRKNWIGNRNDFQANFVSVESKDSNRSRSASLPTKIKYSETAFMITGMEDMTLEELDEMLSRKKVIPPKQIAPIISNQFNTQPTNGMVNVTQKEQAFARVEIEQIKELKEIVKTNSTKIIGTIFDTKQYIIAGGCFSSWFHALRPNDIDVFLIAQWTKNADFLAQLARAIAHDSLGKNLNFTCRNQQEYNMHGRTITVYDHKPSYVSVNVQYIVTDYQDHQQLIDDFDMEHTKVAYYRDTLYISPLTLECITNKWIKISPKAETRIKKKRIKKMLDAGWKFHPTQIPNYGV